MQYLDWLWQMLRGDFGQSLYFKTDVLGLVLDKLPTTAAPRRSSRSLFALAISIPLGVLAAVYPNSWIDRLCLALAVVGQALPNFFFALLLIMLFCGRRCAGCRSRAATLAHFVMPTIALGYYVAPAFMRLVRAGMIEVLASDYIRTARAKGLSRPQRRVQARAAQRAGAGGGARRGAARLPARRLGRDRDHLRARRARLPRLPVDHAQDLPVTQAIVLLLSFVYVGLTLAADLANAWLDPRIRVA